MEKLAIVVVAFNRPKSLQRLLNSLSSLNFIKGENVYLHISIDYKNDDVGNIEVKKIADEFEWKYGEKIVDLKNENFGLKRHVLYCGNLTNKYENIIVLEDDLVVSPSLINYAKQVINYYKNDDKIAGYGVYSFHRNPVNGYPFYPLNTGSDVYFAKYACSWGQIWTKDKWKQFYDWYKENEDYTFNSIAIPNNIKLWGEKSWLKYHIAYCIENNKYFVYPQVGLVTNFSEAGVHNNIISNAYQCELIYSNKCNEYRFEKFDDALNIYDAFFENENINKIVDIAEENQIVSDLYGEKVITDNSGFVLSTKKYDYKIEQSFGLNMYPYENNLIYNNPGNDIYLYNTMVKQKNKLLYEGHLKKYIFKLDILSIKDFSYEIYLAIKNKIKK